MEEIRRLVSHISEDIADNCNDYKRAIGELVENSDCLSITKKELFKRIIKVFISLEDASLYDLENIYSEADQVYCLILKCISSITSCTSKKTLEKLTEYFKKILSIIDKITETTTCYCISDDNDDDCTTITTTIPDDLPSWGLNVDNLSLENVKISYKHLQRLKGSFVAIHKTLQPLHNTIFEKANRYNLYDPNDTCSFVDIDYFFKSYDLLYYKIDGIVRVSKTSLHTDLDNYIEVRVLLDDGSYFVLAKIDSIRIRKIECVGLKLKLILDVGSRSYEMPYLKNGYTNRNASEILTDTFTNLHNSIIAVESNLKLIEESINGVKNIFTKLNS